MILQLTEKSGETITARRVPVDVVLDVVQGLPMTVGIRVRPDEVPGRAGAPAAVVPHAGTVPIRSDR